MLVAGVAMPLMRQLNESLKEAQINPSIVVIIIILTIIFFLSGCLHLLIRCLVMRNPRRDVNSIVTVTALQGQLQQLFHLHDSGVEQAYIDTLPVFLYKSVTGLKEGADCAVCLCEFEGEDRLRLLPKCSHAFHMDCIDTWLLSHSTCPLCRRSLLSDDADFAVSHQGLLVDSSRSSVEAEGLHRAASEIEAETTGPAEISEDRIGSTTPAGVSKRYAESGTEVVGASVAFPKGHPQSEYAGKVLTVQLGRFRVVEGNAEGAGGGVSSSITGSRRSYSVGSYEYVLDPWSSEVVIAPTPLHKRNSTPRRPALPGHRATLSECAEEDAMFPFTPAAAHYFHSPFRVERPPLLARPNVCSDANMVRAFSFRQPASHESLMLKVSASRRSLSEADQVLDRSIWNSRAPQDPSSFSGVQLVSASTELSDSAHMTAGTAVSFKGAAAVPFVFAKRTFNWLIGKQRHRAASSYDSSERV